MMDEIMNKNAVEDGWILCPQCHKKTRTKIRDDTVLENFPLYCPKCKGEFLITVKHNTVEYLKKPDAKTQCSFE